MNNQQKKQEQIQLLLKDAFEIKNQIEKLYEQTADVSQKISELGGSITKISTGIKSVAKSLGKYGGYVAVAGAVLGETIKIVGKFWEKNKNKKIANQMLPKKQEIAKAKLSIVTKNQERISQHLQKIEQYIKQESDIKLDFKNINKYDILSQGYNHLIETYFTFKHLLYVLDFFSQEFNAWLTGMHQSNAKLLTTSEIYKEAINELIKYNNFPKTNIYKKLTLGSCFIISNSEKSKYGYLNKEAIDYFDYLSRKRINSQLFPFNQENRDFNFLYANYLKENEYIKKSSINKILFPLITAFFIIAFSLGFYFAFDYSYVWGSIGILLGFLASFIVNKLFKTQLVNIIDLAQIEIDGYSKIKNKKVLKKFKRQRSIKFVLAFIIDLIGMSSYLLDAFTAGFGEAVDVVWAPISGILISILFKERIGFALIGGTLGIAEEAIPFTDAIPMALITWAGIYMTGKNKTLQKMGYIEPQKHENI